MVAHREFAADRVEGDVAGDAVDDEVAADGRDCRVLVQAADESGCAHDAEFECDLARHHDADVGARGSAETAEHLDEVVPAQLRVIDLERCSVVADAQVFAGHRVHLDPSERFVVADNVDLAADERDLEFADCTELNNFGAVEQPLFLCHFSP